MASGLVLTWAVLEPVWELMAPGLVLTWAALELVLVRTGIPWLLMVPEWV